MAVQRLFSLHPESPIAGRLRGNDEPAPILRGKVHAGKQFPDENYLRNHRQTRDIIKGTSWYGKEKAGAVERQEQLSGKVVEFSLDKS